MKTVTQQFRPHAPYDFDMSAAFATYGGGRYAADSFEDGRFRRAVESEGGPVLVAVESQRERIGAASEHQALRRVALIQHGRPSD